jgi:hypothetical protein
VVNFFFAAGEEDGPGLVQGHDGRAHVALGIIDISVSDCGDRSAVDYVLSSRDEGSAIGDEERDQLSNVAQTCLPRRAVE